MVFSQAVFLFRFLPAFMILYFATYLLPAKARFVPRMRNIILVLGSLFFYAWGDPNSVILLLFSMVADYLLARLIHAFRGTKGASVILSVGILINLWVLLFFKGEGLVEVPIGVSFFTLQKMSYLIDIYRRKAVVQKDLLDFAVFVTMFPKLVAGPIVRYADMEKRLRDHKAEPEQILYGCKRFIVGLSKKVLLADQLALMWEEVALIHTTGLNLAESWLGMIVFGLRIYFDFSGYSDMAIGLSAVLGFTLPENFKYPYLAASVTEFFRKWHVTLGKWFRDYVYIPLGGNRKGVWRQLRNLLIVWLLTGLWHGFKLHFMLWGLWIVCFLILEKVGLKMLLGHLPKVVGWLYTMLVILFGWTWFAMEDIGTSWQYIKAMIGCNGAGIYDSGTLFLLREYAVLLVVSVAACLPGWHGISLKLQGAENGPAIALRRSLEKLILAFLLMASIIYVIQSGYRPFLYFRF